MSDYSVNLNEAGGASPFAIQLAEGIAIRPFSVYAEWDGSGAGGSFHPALRIRAQDGTIVATTRPEQIFDAGDTGVVTYAPFLHSETTVVPPVAGGLWFSVSRTDFGANATERLYLAPTDGGLASLIYDPGNQNYAIHPVPSPDGSKVAFLYADAVASDRLAVIDADGTNRINLVLTNGNKNPKWIGNNRIAFWRGNTLRGIDADGTNLATIRSGMGSGSAAWDVNPDGTKIAYILSGAPNRLMIIDVDGTNDTQLVANVGAVLAQPFPRWRLAPNDTTIVYRSAVSADLRQIQSDGTGDASIAAVPTGYFGPAPMMADDRFFYIDTTTALNWKIGQYVFPTTKSLVSPTYSVFRNVNFVYPATTAGRVWAVIDDALMPGGSTLDLGSVVASDGSDYQVAYIPDESGAPFFEEVHVSSN